MIHKTRGIVFRTVKFSESSVVSKIYTEKFGMQSYLINGVRSPKSKIKAALLQVMSLLEMEVYHNENRNLHRVKEMQAAPALRNLLFHPLKSAVGLFMMELLNKCIHEEEANEALFAFIQEKIISLDETPAVSSGFLLRFLLELSALLGFYPHGSCTAAMPCFDLMEGTFTSGEPPRPSLLTPELSAQLALILQQHQAPPATRRTLLEALLQYFSYHVPNFTTPKSLQVLDAVFHH